MTKILIAVIVAFSAGFFTNRYIIKNNSVPATSEKCIQLDEAKSNLIKISQNEYQEYTKIKDLKQKYEKADELLGKIMLLFLADVGFRTQNSPAVETTSATSEPPVTSATPSTFTPAPVGTIPSTETLQVNTGLQGKAALISSLRSEAQIMQALNAAVIENPKIEGAKGSSPSVKQIAMLDGIYLGQVKFFDPKRDPLAITWELNQETGKTTPYGTFRLAVHGPGKDSETRGNGEVDNIKTLADDPNGLIIDACGNECYFQLYYNAPSDQFYGNYYEGVKGQKNKFQRLGIVGLKK